MPTYLRLSYFGCIVPIIIKLGHQRSAVNIVKQSPSAQQVTTINMENGNGKRKMKNCLKIRLEGDD